MEHSSAGPGTSLCSPQPTSVETVNFPSVGADGAHSRVMGITDQQLALRTQRQTAWVVQQRCIANAVFMTWFARHSRDGCYCSYSASTPMRKLNGSPVRMITRRIQSFALSLTYSLPS